MDAVVMRLLAERRGRWREWTGLALLMGLLAGVVLTTAAGARRTETAYPRLLEDVSAADFLISAAFNGLGSGLYDEVAALPQVAVAGTLAGINLLPVPDGPLAAMGSVVAIAGVDGRMGVAVNRPKLLAGACPILPGPPRPWPTRRWPGCWASRRATRFPCWRLRPSMPPPPRPSR